MKRNKAMYDFIEGKCAAMADRNKFIDRWFDSDKNPCSVCGEDKSKCSFYKELVAKGAIDEKEDPP